MGINFRILTTLLLSLLILGCNSNTKTYVGKEIKLDFTGVRSIEDQDWIEIDGIKYTHYSNYEKQSQDSISLPASRSKYFVRDTEKFEPVNPFTISILLGSHVDANSYKNDHSIAVVKEDQQFLMYTHGTLILHNKNGENVTVITPKDYPVSIEVLD
jgi:hypothetical protein